MARTQVLVLFALFSLFLSNTSAAVSYSNISNSIQCVPNLFFNNGSSILCQPYNDYFVSITLDPISVGNPVYVCDPETTPYVDPSGNFYCLGPAQTLSNGTNLYNFFSFDPVAGNYFPSAQSYPATKTKFKQNYLFMAVENSTVNASFVSVMMFDTSNQGSAYCSFVAPNYTAVEDFTTYQGQVYVLALMANGSYDVLNVNCTASPAVVNTNFYQPPTNNSLFPGHGGIDIFSSRGIPYLLVFDPLFPNPVSISTQGTQINVTSVSDLPSKFIKKVIPINVTTFVTYDTCSVKMFTFNSTFTLNVSATFNFGCWYFKASYISSSNLFYIDDGINYFFLNLTDFQLYNIYSWNPVVPLSDGSTVYFDRNGYFVQNGTTGKIDFNSIGLAFSPSTFYVTAPYTTYYLYGQRAGSNATLVVIDVLTSSITEIQLSSQVFTNFGQTILGVTSINPDNLTFATVASEQANTVALWCNNNYTFTDNPKGSEVFINSNNCTITLINSNTAQFKYNETVYGTTNGSNIQLVDINSQATLQSVASNINSDIINDCNWGAFDSVPTPGATVVVNGFFASCGNEGSDNYLISEDGADIMLPGTAEGYIEIFNNNTFRYCVPSADYTEIIYCQLSNITSWGSNPINPNGGASGGGGAWVVILLLLLALGGGGAYYWFYYRKRQFAGKYNQPDHYQPFARAGNSSMEQSSE